jgi:DNA modification methylase
MNTKHTIINGDSHQMNEITDKSVHLIITSPPYWQLKDYGTDRQIGFNAHLLKTGLAEVDDGMNFKYKHKFLTL